MSLFLYRLLDFFLFVVRFSLITVFHLIFSSGMMIGFFIVLGLIPSSFLIFLLNLLPMEKDYHFLVQDMNLVSFAFFLAVVVPYLCWIVYRFCIRIGLYHPYLSYLQLAEEFKKEFLS